MFFLTNDDKKVNIGWSAKCGCTFVKKLFYYLSDIHKENYDEIHSEESYKKIKKNDNYTNIIICRNPYLRLVSGYLHKFQISNVADKWKEKENKYINFQNLVDLLGNWKIIDYHHFTKQLSEEWNNNIKTDYVFDISNINYSILENLFNKKLNTELIKDFYQKHSNKHNNLSLNKINEPKLYETPIEFLCGIECSYNQFYNLDLKTKVYNFYQKDFEFFKKHNIFYDIEI